MRLDLIPPEPLSGHCCQTFLSYRKRLRTGEGESVSFPVHLCATRILQQTDSWEKLNVAFPEPGVPGNFQLRPLGPRALHQEKSGQIAYCPAEL